MNKQETKKYIYLSLAGFGSLVLSIAFFFCLYRIDSITRGFSFLNNLLAPFIYGFVIAYLLAPICQYFERVLSGALGKKMKNPDKYKKTISFISIGISLIIAILTCTFFLYLVLPQVWTSIVNIINNVPDTVARLTIWAEGFIEKNPELSMHFQQTFEPYFNQFNTWVQTDFMAMAQHFVTEFSVRVVGIVNFFKNFLIGLIVSIYLLASRKLFMAQGKKISYSLLNEKHANAIIGQVRYTSKVFGGFIRGKLLDSLIIGIICFVVCSALKLPYAMLVSVIVGITNIIPFFGPFIGAIPSIILIFTVSPIQSLYFLIFVIILQQFDGNILGPKILGQTVGISGFWVLFSILFFGGLWGFVGMVVGVPLFAVINDIFSKFIKYKLKKRNLSADTKDYDNLDVIESGVYKEF